MEAFHFPVVILAAAAAIMPPSVCRAMTVTPIQLEMSSAGTASRSAIVVTNDGMESLPVEIALRRLSEEEDGRRTYFKGGEEEFLVLPPQALIRPGASQVFRLQWVGEPMLQESASFMLFVSQVPVKWPANKAPVVQVVMSIGCMVNVAPPRGTASLRVSGADIVIDKSGKHHPSITVENPTRVHALLPHSTIRLSGQGWSRELTPDFLGASVGIGLVQPGRRRRFVLPVDLPVSLSNFAATIDLKPNRP